jgi:hypothetical protein
MECHIRKLLTDYGDVCVIWFDGLANHVKYDPERFHHLVHELSPHTLINDRLGEGYDFVTPEQFIPRDGIPARTGKPLAGLDPGGDRFFQLVTSWSRVPLVDRMLLRQVRKYRDGTLELTPVYQEPYPSPERFQPWETCMTMGQSWAHNPRETEWKAPEELVRNLVNVVSRGGNYLLNVGPTARGAFPPEAIERLQYIGRWMQAYHETIYGNTYSPLQGQPWGQATRQGDRIHLHMFEKPSDGRLTVAPFPGQARTVSQFDGQALAFSQAGPQLEIALPAPSSSLDHPVLVVEIDPAEKAWREYSAPAVTTVAPNKYLRDQATASFVINLVINGLIAFFSYRTQGPIPFANAAIDVLITVFIIAFLTSWIVVGLARGEYRKGNIARTSLAVRGWRLPKGAPLRALVIALACALGLGGIVLNGLIYLFSPIELSNWTYIVLKALYTGAGGALASALTILSVVSDESRETGKRP